MKLIKREAAVGPYSADILAKVIGEEDHMVVIENWLFFDADNLHRR